MNLAENLIWTAHAGAYGMLILCCMVIAVRHRTASAAQHVIWAGSCGLGILTLNGLLMVLAPDITPADFHILRVLSGPSCVALSALSIRDWLGARQRNRVIDLSVMGITPTCILASVGCLWLPEPYTLLAAGVVAILGILAICGLCLWAALLGDRLAWLAALGAFVFAWVVAGHYGLALGYLYGLKAHMLVAAASAVIALFMSILVWTRSRKKSDALRNTQSSTSDPMTGLDNGITIIKKIIAAQKRLQLRGAKGEVLAVMVFNFEALVRHIGPGGAQELLVRLGARVSREIGLINPVGRYYDRCYIVLLETAVSSEETDRQIALLTEKLSHPMDIMGIHGEDHAIVLNVGVGRASLTHQVDVANVLDRAQRSARTAAYARQPLTENSQPIPFADSASDLENESANGLL